MTNSYKKLLKKITNTEKRLKPNRQEISAILDLEIEERNSLKDNEAIEDYKNLKENIGMCSFSLAYQPVKVKTQKWQYADY